MLDRGPTRRAATLVAVGLVALMVLGVAIALAASGGESGDTQQISELANDVSDPQTQADARQSIEAQRRDEADRTTSAARADRADSQDRYADATDSEALAIAREQLPQVTDQPAFDPFRSASGEHVEHYFDNSEGALITTTDGDTALVDSPLPLRGRTDSGELKPVDLSLEKSGGRYEPKAAPVRSSLPNDPVNGVTLPYQGGTLTVRPERVDPAGDPHLHGDKLYWPNVSRDSDLAAAALPTGVSPVKYV